MQDYNSSECHLADVVQTARLLDFLFIYLNLNELLFVNYAFKIRVRGVTRLGKLRLRV